MLFFCFWISEWPFPSTWQPFKIPHVSQKNLSLCNQRTLPENHALFGQLYNSYTNFRGRSFVGKSQAPPGVTSVVGRSGRVVISNGWRWWELKPWNDCTRSCVPRAEEPTRQGEPDRRAVGEGGNPRFVFGVGVCLGCVFCWGGGEGVVGKLGFWCCLFFYNLFGGEPMEKSCGLIIYKDFGKIFMISKYLPAFLRVYPLWGDGQCGCFFSKISMILSPDLGENLKWS